MSTGVCVQLRPEAGRSDQGIGGGIQPKCEALSSEPEMTETRPMGESASLLLKPLSCNIIVLMNVNDEHRAIVFGSCGRMLP